MKNVKTIIIIGLLCGSIYSFGCTITASCSPSGSVHCDGNSCSSTGGSVTCDGCTSTCPQK